MPDERFIQKRPPTARAEQLASLSHLEYRVLMQYLLSADDFGVMRFSARILQDDNDALMREKPRDVEAALDRLVRCGILRTFDAGTPIARRYVYQPDWQEYQHIRYPSRTSHPAPPLDACTTHTQWLLTAHPGGDKQLASWRAPGTFTARRRAEPTSEATNEVTNGPTSEATSAPTNEESPLVTPYLARARPSPLLLLLPIALASDGSARETIAADQAWERFQAAYPAERRNGGVLANQAFIAACQRVGLMALLANIEEHKRSEQWKKGMIPSLSKYFELELWLQHPKAADSGQRSRRLASVDELRRSHEGGAK